MQGGLAAVGAGTLPVWGPGAKRPGRRRLPAGGTTSSQTESKIRTGSTHGLLRECAERPRPGRGALPPVCNIDSSHFNKGSRLRSIMVGRNCNAADPLTAPRHSPRRSHRAKHRNFVADFCAGASPGQPEALPQTPPRGSAPLGTSPGPKGPEPGRFAPHRRVVTSGTRIQTMFAAPVNHG